MGAPRWTRSIAVLHWDPAAPVPWPLAHTLLLTALCLAGIALRMSCAGRPYWIDEAWVLNSVLSPTLGAMFNYREWLQTTPPGLLLLLRAVATAVPQWLDHLRWLFILCGIVTLLMFVRTAQAMLGRGFVCLACAVFALSPALVWNATELKQYSVDALATTASLYCGLAYIARPSAGLYTRWCALNLLFVTVSFSAVFCLPAMVLAGLAMHDARRWPARLRAVLPHTLLAGCVVGLIHLVFVRPHAGMESLAQFWAQGFHATSGESVLFYWRRSLSLLFDFLDIKTASPGGLLLLLAITGIGAVSVLWAADGVRRGAARVMVLTMPILATLVANQLGIYPLGEYRMVAFLAPCLIVLMVRGLAWAVDMAFAPCRGAIRHQAGHALAMTMSLAMVVYLANTLSVQWWGPSRGGGERLWRGNVEILPAIDYLRAVDALRRPLFVHAFYQQLFSYYTRETPLRSPVSFARSGYPCCVPSKPWRGYGADPDEVAREVATLVARNGTTPFHVLLYARPNWPSRDAVAPYVAAFSARACKVAWRQDSFRVALLRIECAAGG